MPSLGFKPISPKFRKWITNDWSDKVGISLSDKSFWGICLKVSEILRYLRYTEQRNKKKINKSSQRKCEDKEEKPNLGE